MNGFCFLPFYHHLGLFTSSQLFHLVIAYFVIPMRVCPNRLITEGLVRKWYW